MRDIKFRGLVVEGLASGSKWITGGNEFHEVFLNHADKLAYIEGHAVEYDSITQYTGLKDKNGTDIYEGDVVYFGGTYEVKYGLHGVPDIEAEQYVDKANGFYLTPQHDLKDIEPFNMEIPLNSTYARHSIIIGNIYENPELLEASK